MIGQWVAEALAHAEISQAELTRRLHKRFNWADDRTVINKIIKGRRDVTATEMMEISQVTEYPPPNETGLGPNDVRVMGFVGAGAEIDPEFEQVPPEGLHQITLPFPLPGEMIAFEVRGDSMLPVYKDGEIIVVYEEQRRPLTAFYGEDAVVRTTDGRRFLKTIQRGANGNVNLFSFNAPLIEDVRLEWIGEIFLSMPRSQLAPAPSPARPPRTAKSDEELAQEAQEAERIPIVQERLDRFLKATGEPQDKPRTIGSERT